MATAVQENVSDHAGDLSLSRNDRQARAATGDKPQCRGIRAKQNLASIFQPKRFNHPEDFELHRVVAVGDRKCCGLHKAVKSVKSLQAPPSGGCSQTRNYEQAFIKMDVFKLAFRICDTISRQETQAERQQDGPACNCCGEARSNPYWRPR
jgi:hypothetical protein